MTNELVETARRIAPELGETAAEDNALRRLSDRTLENPDGQWLFAIATAGAMGRRRSAR